MARALEDKTFNDVWVAFARDSGLLPPENNLTSREIVLVEGIRDLGLADVVERMVAPFIEQRTA